MSLCHQKSQSQSPFSPAFLHGLVPVPAALQCPSGPSAPSSTATHSSEPRCEQHSEPAQGEPPKSRIHFRNPRGGHEIQRKKNIWQWHAFHKFNPFSPGSFIACAASVAWAFLALLFKNHSPCVKSSSSPLLHKVEPPVYAHYKNVNRQHCAWVSIHTLHSLSFSSRWKKGRNIWGVTTVFSASKGLKTVISTLSCQPVPHTCSLEYDKASSTPGSKSLSYQQTPQLKPP